MPTDAVVVVEPGGVERAIRKLSELFDAEVRPSVRRHEFYMPPGEARRRKARKARMREIRRLKHEERRRANLRQRATR